MTIEERLFESRYRQIVNLLKIAKDSKYYGRIFEEIGLDLNRKISYSDFVKIPFLDKKMYNEQKYNLIVNRPDDFDVEYLESLESGYLKNQYLDKFQMRYMITSGSTGQPLEVLKSYRGLDKDYMTLNLYRKRVTNYDFKGQFAWIWPENPVVRKFFNNNNYNNVEYRRENSYGYKYMLYEHSDDNYNKIYNFFVNNDIQWITSSPSVLFELATFMKNAGLVYRGIKYIECHSEKLHSWQADIIKEVFGVKPLSIYSSNEIQFIAGVGNNGQMRLFNSCFVEFIENAQGIKEIYVTSFNEKKVPIIRYKLGDCGNWAGDCDCNLLSDMPEFVLSGFRSNDLISTRNNTLIEPFVITDSIYLLNLKHKMKICEHKVIQTKVDEFVYYIPIRNRNGILESEIKSFLKEYLESILNYQVFIILKDYNCQETFYGKKYRYFENKIKEA